jgi:hypothetical protein
VGLPELGVAVFSCTAVVVDSGRTNRPASREIPKSGEVLPSSDPDAPETPSCDGPTLGVADGLTGW